MSFFVTEYGFATTGERVAALNKRAAKAGIPATATLVELSRKQKSERSDFGTVRKYWVIEAEITGLEAVKLGDWTLAATLDHDAAGNIFRTNPRFTVEIPEEFRGTDATRCDHCNTRRLRNQTVLVWNEADGFKQVGSDCVKMFLGVSPASLIAWMGELAIIEEDDERCYGGWGRDDMNVTEFVAVAALFTEAFGFVAKSTAGPYDTPTATIVSAALTSRRFSQDFPKAAEVLKAAAQSPDKVTERANALAEEALEWIAGETGSDYITNLRLAAARDAVGRNAGLLASLPNAYKRAKATEAERATKAAAKAALPDSVHVGKVGDKITFSGKVVYTNRSAPYSYYGPESLFAILVSDKGEKFFASTTVETAFGRLVEEVEADEVITVTATVKEHKVTDKGEHVTKITRAKAVLA